MKISIGVIIAICLMVYWYMQDHPRTAEPVKQGYETHLAIGVV